MSVSFQSNYGINMPIGIPGQIADCGFKNTLSPAALEIIPPAVGVMKPLNLDYKIMLPRNDIASISASIDMVAGNTVGVTINGNVIAPIPYATSSAATLQALADQIKLLPNISSALVGGTGNRVITIVGVAGTAVTATAYTFVQGVGGTVPVGTIANGQTGVFFGVTQYIYNRQNIYVPLAGPNASISSAGAVPYFTGDVVPTLTQGRIYVIPESVVTSNSPVYLRVAANGANTQLGAFSGVADGANSVLIPSTQAIWREGNGVAGGIAVLEVHLP